MSMFDKLAWSGWCDTFLRLRPFGFWFVLLRADAPRFHAAEFYH